MALESVIQAFQSDHCYFWGVHNEAELDLFILHQGKRLGFEFKYTDAPSITSSMHKALELLKLDHLYVIYPGQKSYILSDKITVYPLREFILTR